MQHDYYAQQDSESDEQLNGLGYSFSDFTDDIGITSSDDDDDKPLIDIGGAIDTKLDDAKQDLKDSANDYVDEKLNAEVARTSESLGLTIASDMPKEEVEKAVQSGQVVLAPDGKFVRNEQGQTITLADYEAQKKAELQANTLKIMQAIAALMISIRDNPTARDDYFAKLDRLIATTSGATRQKWIDTKKKVNDWLLVNLSKNEAAWTPEQRAQVAKFAELVYAMIIAHVQKFRADRVAYDKWKMEAQAKISLPQSDESRQGRINNFTLIKNGVEFPGTAQQYVAKLKMDAYQEAIAKLTKPGGEAIVAGAAAKGVSTGTGGGGILLAIGAAVAIGAAFLGG